MKTLILAFIFSMFFPNDKTGLTIEQNRILLSIDKNTTPEQIATYRESLLKKNIKFWVEKVAFDEKEKIKYIKIMVDCNDGFKGSSAETFLNEKTKIGFYRIYNTKGSPFGMSPLPAE